MKWRFILGLVKQVLNLIYYWWLDPDVAPINSVSRSTEHKRAANLAEASPVPSKSSAAER